MNGLTLQQVGVLGGGAVSWTIEGVGDANDDGKADLIWRHGDTGTVACWMMDGVTLHEVEVPGSAGPQWVLQP